MTKTIPGNLCVFCIFLFFNSFTAIIACGIMVGACYMMFISGANGYTGSFVGLAVLLFILAIGAFHMKSSPKFICIFLMLLMGLAVIMLALSIAFLTDVEALVSVVAAEYADNFGLTLDEATAKL